MDRADRVQYCGGSARVAELGGTIIFNLVDRYWNVRGLISFLRNYAMWLEEKLSGKRIELGD